MIDFKHIQANFMEFKKHSLTKIAGDASDRSYYRFKTTNNQSLVCMEFKEWNSGFGGNADEWIEMQIAFQERGVSVPDILFIDKENNSIWISDLGDSFLISGYEDKGINFQNPSFTKLKAFYEESIHQIIGIQYPKIGYENLTHTQRGFDFEKLTYEMNFFLDHFMSSLVTKSNVIHFSNELLNNIYINEFEPLCSWIANRPKVLCHRDFHSKNLMVKSDKIYIIDFQDARMGPHTYDIASLIRDSYAILTKESQNHLFHFYLDALSSHVQLDYSDIFEEYQKVAFQRNIKALGSFAYLSLSKNKHSYLKYVKPTLQSLHSHIDHSLTFAPCFSEMISQLLEKWEIDENIYG